MCDGKSREKVLDRLVGLCLALLFAAVAIYVAVRLIESVAAALVVVAAVIGGAAIAGLVTRLLWRHRRMNRW